MKIDILTLFPHMFDGFLTESIIKRAIDAKKVEINLIDFRKYSKLSNKIKSECSSHKIIFLSNSGPFTSHTSNRVKNDKLIYSGSISLNKFINEHSKDILMSLHIIDAPYKFLSNTWSTRGLVAAMNFLMWFGNTTILLLAGMLGIDTSLYEAAEVDGATSSQVFFRITLPLLRPILVYVMVTSLIGGLQMYDVPQILTNGQGNPARTTMTLIMYLNKHLYSKNYGLGGALSVILFIVTGILSVIVFKMNQASEK